jgi:hypothetical protein
MIVPSKIAALGSGTLVSPEKPWTKNSCIWNELPTGTITSQPGASYPTATATSALRR